MLRPVAPCPCYRHVSVLASKRDASAHLTIAGLSHVEGPAVLAHRGPGSPSAGTAPKRTSGISTVLVGI